LEDSRITLKYILKIGWDEVEKIPLAKDMGQ
jgi:hypothetical protein